MPLPDVYDFSSRKSAQVKEELGGKLNPVERLSVDTAYYSQEQCIDTIIDKINEVVAFVNILGGRASKFPASNTRAISAQAENAAPEQSADNSNVGGK